MKVVTAATMRELDRRMMEEHGVDGVTLMERAGGGLADICLQVVRAAGKLLPRVLIVAGKGNNGGDGFVAARLLSEWGCAVDVWLCAETSEVSGDAAAQLEKLENSGLFVVGMPNGADWDQAEFVYHTDLIVDALLGTGFVGEPRGAIGSAIEFVNRVSHRALVVSVDVPSGLSADSGRPQGACVHADRTVSMGLPKLGFTMSGAMAYTGSIDVIDLGMPEAYIDELDSETTSEILVADEIRASLPPLAWDAHKGSHGRVLLIGGSRRFTGAIVLAARAATRVGAGLVTVLVPESLAAAIAGANPELMIVGCPETDSGSLDSALWSIWRARFNDHDVCLIGPGMTSAPETAILVKQVLRESKIPLVLDADALTVLQGQPSIIVPNSKWPVILTPHPGEFAEFMLQPVADVQANREGMAIAASKLTGAVVVLKGAGTLVAHGDSSFLNLTGNPGLATGGSGDILAGMITALVGRGVDVFEASKAAVWLHGSAADYASYGHTRAATRPTDVLEALPLALQQLQRLR